VSAGEGGKAAAGGMGGTVAGSGGASAAVGGAGGAGAGGAGEAGHAGSGGSDAPEPARLIDAWPRELNPGQAVLFYGTNLNRVTSVRMNQAVVTPSYADGSKLVAIVPADTEAGSVTIGLEHSGAVAPADLGLHVTALANPTPDSPHTPLIPAGYDSVGFPVVSDQWRNECKGTNVDAVRYFFEDAQTEGDLLQFGGRIVYFSNSESPVSGSYSRASGLMRLSIQSTLYVGLLSKTEHDYMLRMVLFPASAGGQLVLLGCRQQLADAVGVVCPNETTEVTGLSDAPKDCGQ
jgi:hypothetical protein